MKDDIRKLNDDELNTISGGKTNVLDFSDVTDDIPEKCPVNPRGKHSFVMETNPNRLFVETCEFCGCKRQVSYSSSTPHKPDRT